MQRHMLLTIASDNPDMSFLLHKHPSKIQTQDTNFGEVHVFYPKPSQVALLLEIDPLLLTKRGGHHSFALKPYVNDRTYAASSFLSVALNQMFRTAMAGRCEKRPELVERATEFEVRIPCLPTRGGLNLVEKLFEPLGYEVEAKTCQLDPEFPEWGQSIYLDVTLKTRTTLQSLLRHLYILIPVTDNEKHYWVGEDEVQKLVNKGQAWLAEHPHKELIASRYLKHRRSLATSALSALDSETEPEESRQSDQAESDLEKKIGLHALRLQAVTDALIKSGATVVGDLGCGEGKLLRHLVEQKQFEQILAMDVSLSSLDRAEQRLERLHEKKRERISLLHGSLLYDDVRLHEAQACCLVEVIEHLEPDRLERVAHNLFQRIRPETLILTTPNREYNQLWESLPAGRFRHADHRFEWTRDEFRQWSQTVSDDYAVTFTGIGEEHPEFGHPTQMAVFRR